MSARRIATEQKILNALETLLKDHSYTGVGINAIARQAGCDKVLIYRYFDGLEGLLQSYATLNDLWWQTEDLFDFDPRSKPISETLSQLLQKHVEILRAKPVTLEVMAWEMSHQNNLTIALGRTRSARGMLLVKQLRQYYDNPNIDIGGILGVFGAAINFLLIRTRKQPVKNMTEEWWRLQQTVDSLLKRHE
ncbi:MAG: AcrR family transcriptional regulator [Gammaproteobacteria bacterium]